MLGSPTIFYNLFGLVLHIFLYLQEIGNTTTSDWLKQSLANQKLRYFYKTLKEKELSWAWLVNKDPDWSGAYIVRSTFVERAYLILLKFCCPIMILQLWNRLQYHSSSSCRIFFECFHYSLYIDLYIKDLEFNPWSDDIILALSKFKQMQTAIPWLKGWNLSDRENVKLLLTNIFFPLLTMFSKSFYLWEIHSYHCVAKS